VKAPWLAETLAKLDKKNKKKPAGDAEDIGKSQVSSIGRTVAKKKLKS
jgi:hypothetical protein